MTGVQLLLPACDACLHLRAEAQTFLASLRAALGLDPAATLEACANRLEQLLADRRACVAKGACWLKGCQGWVGAGQRGAALPCNVQQC